MYQELPISERIKTFMYGVYGWMAGALALTAGSAYYVAMNTNFFVYIQTNSTALIFLFLLQIGLVIGLSLFISRMSYMTALIMFLIYAISVGITLSSIFYLFEIGSIVSTFITTAGMFFAMAAYGYLTKSDLTAMGSISIMMLFGLIIGLLVNLFLRNPMMDLVLSGIGVVIFTLLTAYDTQKIKQIGQRMLADKETMQKVAILGALTLYLDFINLFLYLLRFMGKRRED